MFMRYVISAVIWVFLTASLFAGEVPPNPNVVVAYQKPRSKAFEPIYERLKERKVLERLSRFLYPVNFPAKFKISTAECGGILKPFNRRDGVVLCYEVVQSIRDAARMATKSNPELYQTVVIGGMTQAMLYRTAIGMMDVLNIPVWGRYTDAADTMAAIVMLKFGPTQVAAINMLGTSVYLRASSKVWEGSDFAEIRSPTVQRYYNYVCLAFGSDANAFAHFKNDIAFMRRARFVDGRGRPIEGVTDDDNFCSNQFAVSLRNFQMVMAPHIDEAKRAQLDGFQIFESGDFQ